MPGSDGSLHDGLKIRPHSANSGASYGSREDVPFRRTKTSLGLRPSVSANSSRRSSLGSVNLKASTHKRNSKNAWQNENDKYLLEDKHSISNLKKPGGLLQTLVGEDNRNGLIPLNNHVKPWSATELPDYGEDDTGMYVKVY